MSERLLLEVYPAVVFAPRHAEFEETRAKVFVTDQRVIVWTESSGGFPMIDEAITGEKPQATLASLVGQLQVNTANGPVFVSRGSGCGCRSPLRLIDAPVGR